MDMDIAVQQTVCCQGSQCQLNGGSETPRIGNVVRTDDLGPVHFRQAVHELAPHETRIGLQAEFIRKVNDARVFAKRVFLKEMPRVPMRRAEEQDIDRGIDLIGKTQIRHAQQVVMDAVKRRAGTRSGIHEIHLDHRVAQDDAQEFASRISGSAHDPYLEFSLRLFYHFLSMSSK